MARLFFDWRRVLVYSHRWLGIAGCLLFIAWFVSGVVMMYARMPSLSAEERLMRIPALDLSTARVEPSAALATTGLAPRTARMAMLGDRPVYQFSAGANWATVYADTGEQVTELSQADTLTLARAFVPEHAATIHLNATLLDSDQWTLSSALRPLMPLHRFSLGDAAGTDLYISALTGEAVMKTTRRERVWGYLGAVLHWLYFTPFRRDTALWVNTIVYLSIAGSLMCLSGIVWGLWRFSPSSRFRLKRVPARSPYAGMMKWHHYAGLIFGLTTFTWIFSGLMSMTPWDWSPGNAPTRAQREVVSGGPFGLDGLTLDGIRRGVGQITAEFAPKEVEVVQFRGERFLLAYRAPLSAEEIRWGNTDLPAFVAPQTLEHRFVSLSAEPGEPFTRFKGDEFLVLASDVMPGVTVTDARWLEDYDSYYYSRSGALSLPVLRVQYDDPVQTWLYFDPFRGAVVQKEERLSRLERWLYHGLHSLDFPFLYYRRPLWDVVLILLSIGGIVSSATTVLPAVRRLRGHLRRLNGRRPGAADTPASR
ncbi:MAG: hypothetical protein ABL986_23605 [Vicinamibacterales bacterium]